MRALFNRIPGVKVAELVLSIMRYPDGRPEQFVRTAMSKLVLHGRRERLTVSTIAQTMRSTVRTVEHTLHELGLPPPNELLGWITLLYVGWSAERALKPVDAFAQQLGFRAGSIHRLRHRLILRCRGRWTTVPLLLTSNSPALVWHSPFVVAEREKLRGVIWARRWVEGNRRTCLSDRNRIASPSRTCTSFLNGFVEHQLTKTQTWTC